MNRRIYITIILSMLMVFGSCSDFVEIDPPRTDLIRATVFTSDQTADAAVVDLYYQMSNITGFASGGVSSVTFAGALSSDEATNRLAFLADTQAFNDNAILPGNGWVLSLWSDMYSCIYKTNAILEGLAASGDVSESLKHQLEGEAKFIRAFCYFYLINLFDDPALVLSTDHKVNQNIGRSDQAIVYDQIKKDLMDASELLLDDFSASDGERTRVNKYAALALLSRVYLYQEDWSKAEQYATLVIDNTSLFSLQTLTEVFKKNSSEAIWQLWPQSGNVYDRTTARSYSRLQPSLIAAFTTDDQRKTNWMLAGPGVADKYKSGDNTYSEYSMVIRLAELYFIRAEARAQLENISGAQADINAIRSRAGLIDTDATDTGALLAAIENERRLELFLEWGHRWFDLKRWGRADAVLSAMKPDWESHDALYPIPENQIMNDPAMKDAQNPGY